MKRPVAVVALACGATLLGCEPVVVDLTPDHLVQNGPGAGSGGGAISAMSSALAYKGSDAPAPFEDMAEIVSGPGTKFHPDALVLSFANVHQTACGFVLPGYTSSSSCPDVEGSQLVLAIPPELFAPGMISLGDPRIQFSSVIHLPGCGGGSGFGMGFGGQLEIVARDATTVTVKLTDVDPMLAGQYVAEQCGTPLPPYAPPTDAVAVPGSALSGDPSSGTGPAADPDVLYVFLGTTPGTCAEPHPTVDCTENSQMVLSLPPALQVPGAIALTDPQIDAVYTAPINSCAAAVPEAGTMTILEASETSLKIRVFDSGWAALDGNYDVAICP
jgi:hypothetical protein